MKLRHIGNKLIPYLIFLITIGMVVAVSYLKNVEIETSLGYLVLTVLMSGTLVFLLVAETIQKRIRPEVLEHPERFFLGYIFGLVAAVGFSFLPIAGWPFPFIFLYMALNSNVAVGIVAGALLLMITAMFSGGSTIYIFLLVFGSGVFTIIVFQSLDQNFHTFLPTFLSSLVLFVEASVINILNYHDRLTFSIFLIPLLNVFVNCLCMIFTLNIYSQSVVHKYEMKYMELNDQLCPLLISLKEKSIQEYYHAIHTAFFCDRIAGQLGADRFACRAGGFYHHIGLLLGENSWKNIQEICREYDFPPGAMQILEEYTLSKNHIVSKETAILLMSDSIITSIMFLLQNGSDRKLDYDRIIPEIINKRLYSSMLSDSKLTLHDIRVMQKIFLGEKLYYDFLR
ncbi:MAG: hypothetical protein PHP50_02785 [Lachnospiraceae bacterium]|nr:hypothetical protein [Lachnospiraceae bacterium]